MNRIKVINDPSDMVSVFHIADTSVKKEVFNEVVNDWKTLEDVEKKYGKEGKNALLYLEKIKLVEVQWVNTPSGTVKSYRSYYNQVQIALSLPISDLADLLQVTIMPHSQIVEYERKILELMNGKKSIFIGTVTDKLLVSINFLKGLIKRSNKLDLKGHNIEKVE